MISPTGYYTMIFRIICQFFTISNHSETVENVKNTTPNLYRKETKENYIDSLNSDLAQEGWQDVLLESDSNKAYDIFLNKLVYYYNKNIPLVKTKSRKKNKRPWITKEILQSIKTRNKLYKLAITSQCNENVVSYKKYRNKLNGLIRLSRKMYYSQKLENNKNHVNGIWDTVNDLTGKNKKDSSNIFQDDGQQLTNPNNISDAFNTYFTNIGPKLA